jgi:uncharacterized MAPEG superfamily protein
LITTFHLLLFTIMGAPSSDDQEFMYRAYAVCSLVLLLKYVYVVATAANPMDHPSEDVEKLNLKLEEPKDLKRNQRCQANDIENIPVHYGIFVFGLLIQGVCNATGNGNTQCSLITYLFIIYTIARVCYTVCYKLALQPFRTIFFALALFSVLINACVIVSSAFAIDIKG